MEFARACELNFAVYVIARSIDDVEKIGL